MTASPRRSFGADFKEFFVRGLVVLLPSILTLWIVVKAYQFVDQTIAEPINRSVREVVFNASRVWEPAREAFEPSPEAVEAELDRRPTLAPTDQNRAMVRAELRRGRINDWWSRRWWTNLIGLGVAIIAVYIAGRLLGGLIGRRIYRRIESFIVSLPVFKQVYPHVKQIVDFLFSDEKPIKFNRVVVVQYPRKGLWSLGFLTGETMKGIATASGDSVTVFIPSSPTPFTGYTITVPRSEVLEVAVTVDEALRFTISGGVLIPPHQQLPRHDSASPPLQSDSESESKPPHPSALTPTAEQASAGSSDIPMENPENASSPETSGTSAQSPDRDPPGNPAEGKSAGK